MRDYTSLSNLKRAAAVAALITVMSAPRIIAGGIAPEILIPSAFFCLLLIAGAATAWETRAGMVGVFPSRSRTLVGVAIALGLAAVAIPIRLFILDPVLRPAVEATEDAFVIEMRYPSTAPRALALILWSAGFEAIFFVAATMAFFARLSNRLWFAIVATTLGRAGVLYFLLSTTGIMAATPLFLIALANATLVSCLLYARTGLVPLMVFAGASNLHLLLSNH